MYRYFNFFYKALKFTKEIQRVQSVNQTRELINILTLLKSQILQISKD